MFEYTKSWPENHCTLIQELPVSYRGIDWSRVFTMLQNTVAYCGMKSFVILKDKIGHSTPQNNAAEDTISVRLVVTPDGGAKSGGRVEVNHRSRKT